MRAPAATACSITATLLVDPFTEIRSGGTSAVSAACSSPGPNVSQPAPARVSTRRTASERLALIEGSTRTSPCGHAARNAAPIVSRLRIS